MTKPETLSGLYMCHYCDKQVELEDKDVQKDEHGKLLWQCPCCLMYNDTPATEPFDD